jgi:hypothetical protein
MIVGVLMLPLVVTHTACSSDTPVLYLWDTLFSADAPVQGDGGAPMQCQVPGTKITFPATQKGKFSIDVIAPDAITACAWAQVYARLVEGMTNIICNPAEAEQYLISAAVPSPRVFCKNAANDVSYFSRSKMNVRDIVNWPQCFAGSPLSLANPFQGNGPGLQIQDWMPDAEAYPAPGSLTDAGVFVISVDPPACNDPPPVPQCPGTPDPQGFDPAAPCASCYLEKCQCAYKAAYANAQASDAQDPTMSMVEFNQLLSVGQAWLASGSSVAGQYPLPAQPWAPPAASFGACMVANCIGASRPGGVVCQAPQ